jgi:zinc/manganese transport system substrate-binding protein
MKTVIDAGSATGSRTGSDEQREMPVRTARSLAAATVVLLLAGCAQGSDDQQPAAAEQVATPAASASATPTASAGAAAGQVPVVTSTNVYGDLVGRVGGSRVVVTPIITDPAADPHSFEANPRTQLALSQARLVVRNGGHYDDFVSAMLDAAGGERQVLDAVEISGRATSAGHAEEGHAEEGPGAGDEEDHFNEHVWYDLDAVSALAGRIADALAAAQPEHAAEFRTNADGLRAAIDGLKSRAAAMKAAHPGKKVAVTEPVPLYLLEACGLENVTPAEFSEAIEEGHDVPVAVLQETLGLVREGGAADVLVHNEQTTGPQTEQLREEAGKAGLPVVGVTETLPAGLDYVGWMSRNLDNLEKALAGGGQG